MAEPKKKKTHAAMSGSTDDFVLTREGLQALQNELEDLKGRGRREVAQRLKEAISYGDLSENSEYEEAKNHQAFIEGRIIELEKMIRDARVVDEATHSKAVVEIGSRVVVRLADAKKGEEIELKIVGATEADPFNNKISSESPMGTAFMGGKVGDIVSVHAPAGAQSYEIMKLA